MANRFIILLAMVSAVLSSCTTSRWVVVDQAVTNQNGNLSVISETLTLTADKEPTAEDPTIRFTLQKIVEKEFEQRVMVERTIQKYRPRWAVWAIGVGGAAFAATAANSSFIYPDMSDRDQLLLNLTSLLTATMTFTQLKPVDQPISTGETRLMRRSGFEVVTDTLQNNSVDLDKAFELRVQYSDSAIVEETNISNSDGSLAINLATILRNAGITVTENSTVQVDVRYGENSLQRVYSIEDFLEPYVVVEEAVVLLRNAPVLSDLNVVGEVGSGSTFDLIENTGNGWFSVRFGGSEVFIQESEASVEWLSDSTSETMDVFQFADVPFGEIDVENSVPILRQNRQADRSLIITNNFLNSDVERSYVDRDHRLFDFYMEAALQMEEKQRFTINVDSTRVWAERLNEIAKNDSTELLYVYLSGTADIIDNELYLAKGNTGPDRYFPVVEIFKYLEKMNPEKLIIVADLQFRQTDRTESGNGQNFSGEVALQRAAGTLQGQVPNSAIIFSNRPGQKSQLFAGAESENQRHHIFTYYWADALKKRYETVNLMLNHLESNVDYTSRRLHDTPQEVRAFGNLTISVRN